MLVQNITNRQSSPNTADLGTDEKATLFGNRRYWESYICNQKTLIWGLEMGGGIWGEAVLGGLVMGGTTVQRFLTISNVEKHE